MNVLQVTTHMNIGGIGNYVLTLSRALQDKGGRVVVASSGGNLEPELSRRGIRHIPVSIRTKFEFSPAVFGAIPRLCRIVNEGGIDIIHAHTRVSQVACFFVSRITGVPYITTCHGFFKTRLRKVFDTWGQKVIAISDSVKAHLEDDLGVDGSRIEVIYSGVDMSRFSRAYSDEEKRIIKASVGIKDYPVVGTIGRLSKVKGHRFLIEALGRLALKGEKAEALIVGDGEEEATLKALAKDLHVSDSVHFLNAYLDTGKFLSIMDIFVFPSMAEGLGIALLEALASGRACIASDIGGIRNIITDGMDGVLVRAGDSAALGGAILSLLNDAGNRERLGLAGRRLVKEKFTLDAMAENVFRLYEKVIKR